jgi:signal transduction histidine kinase
MDLLSWLSQGRRSTGNAVEAAKTKTEVIRLNLFERILYCLGAILCGVTTMCPRVTPYNKINALFLWSYNIVTFLTAVPVLLFLSRVTTQWRGPSWVLLNFSLIIVGVVGSFESLVSNISSVLYVHMNTCVFVLTLLSLILYVYHVARVFIDWVPSMVVVHRERGQLWESAVFCYQSFIANYATNFHTLSLGVVLAADTWYYAVYFFQGSFSNQNYGIFAYVYLMSLALVFTVEMRVRHNEVRDGLNAIESRKAFVRFVSHEVRTPLSTAVMGLELLQQEIHDPSASAHDTDAMLRMIGQSVTAACAIFDDLLQFDSFADANRDDSALDTRHLSAWRAVVAAAEPLTLQAGAAEVDLKWSAAAIAAADNPSGAMTTATVRADERKLAYVVRTLISHAIQSSSRGSMVVLDARLAASNGAAASSLVGRINSATTGSVTVASENNYPPGSAQWWQTTKYGAMFWAATAGFRTFRYSACPTIVPGARPFWPWRGGYPIGFAQMIGSISGAASGALRALLEEAAEIIERGTVK